MTIQKLPKPDLRELTDNMMAFVEESQDNIIHVIRVSKLLLDGNPVSPRRIAEEFQLSEDEISSLLQVAELNEEGDIVGLGLSLVPTPHSFRIDGRQFYAWCAADAIMFPILLQFENDAIIESSDPVSSDPVRLIVTPEGTENLEPGTAVVSHVTEIKNFLTVRSNACNSTHFFKSVETASQYISKQPGLVILSVDEVFKLWQRVWSTKKNFIDQ